MSAKPDMTAKPCVLLGGPDCDAEIHAPDFVQATVRRTGHIYIRSGKQDSAGRPIFISCHLTAAAQRRAK